MGFLSHRRKSRKFVLEGRLCQCLLRADSLLLVVIHIVEEAGAVPFRRTNRLLPRVKLVRLLWRSRGLGPALCVS